MASGAFLTGMPRDTPWEAVPGHGRMVRSKYDSIRPRAIRTHADLTKGCRTTTQAVPQAPGADPKSQRAAFLRASKPGSTGCRRLECWTSSRADTWDFREVGLLHGLVTPLLAGAKCALESVYYRKPRTIECVLHLSRGQDRPPVREHCASAAAWVVRCPCAQSTLHKANFLMRASPNLTRTPRSQFFDSRGHQWRF